MDMYFKRNLLLTDFLFNRNEIFSFIFSLKPLLLSEGGQYFLKNPKIFLPASRKRFSVLLFLDTVSNESSLLDHYNCIIQQILYYG